MARSLEDAKLNFVGRVVLGIGVMIGATCALAVGALAILLGVFVIIAGMALALLDIWRLTRDQGDGR